MKPKIIEWRRIQEPLFTTKTLSDSSATERSHLGLQM